MENINDIQDLLQSVEKRRLNKFDHVVVLMLENRSFDNLLGNLYTPDDFKKPPFTPDQRYAGLKFNGPHFNQIPKEANDGRQGEKIFAQRASSYFSPYPDPGETYGHVNTQLYDSFNPLSNQNKADEKIIAPYNVPDPPLSNQPTMKGFIRDYLSVLRSLKLTGIKGCIYRLIYKLTGVNPPWFKLADDYDHYKTIMECYENDQVPILTTLAKSFAVFDHWHCDVPSQTYPNRAFWHSGTSYGYVNNSPIENWILKKNSPTLFNMLSDKKINWKIYTDNIISLTGIIHFQQLAKYKETNFTSYTQFLADAANGQLPEYSFIEPRFFTPHNDQHPSAYDSLDPTDNVGKVGSVLLGEQLIREVYYAIKQSKGDAQGKGSNWQNTLLIITHDEHGGCFDHVPPGEAPAPQNMHYPLQDDFKFDRLGVRVPMVMVSAYIKPNTIINTPMRHTSFLKTMCLKWDLNSLTKRDSTAPDFSEVFNTDEARTADEWPELPEIEIPEAFMKSDFSEAPVGNLEKTMLQSLAFWKFNSTESADGITTAAEAHAFLKQHYLNHTNSNDRFPGANLSELTFKDL